MLIKITTKCTMGCSHCISDCKPEGIDMDSETFDQVIRFLKAHRQTTINISGGEPMEHPYFWEMYEKIVTALPISIVTVITNGEWIDQNFDTFSDMQKKFKNPVRYWQISRDNRYYPRPLSDGFMEKIGVDKNVFVEDTIRHIYPKGRAVDNNIVSTVNAPSCFNIRSVSNNVEVLSDLLYMMTSLNKNCTPSIEPDGSIKLGESSLCPACSNIWKSDFEILQDIRNFKCRGCSELIKKAVQKYGPQIETIMK